MTSKTLYIVSAVFGLLLVVSGLITIFFMVWLLEVPAEPRMLTAFLAQVLVMGGGLITSFSVESLERER